MVGWKTVSWIKILKKLIEASVILKEKKKDPHGICYVVSLQKLGTWKVFDYWRGRFLFPFVLKCISTVEETF